MPTATSSDQLNRWAAAHVASVLQHRPSAKTDGASVSPKTRPARATRLAGAGPAQAPPETGKPRVLPLQDVTADFFHTDTPHRITTSLAATTTTDGEILLATVGSPQDGGSSAAHLWDVGQSRHLRSLSGSQSSLYGLAWTQAADDRCLLATSGEDRAARIWDPDTGTCLRTLTGHNGQVDGVAWARTPDEQLLLATASLDGTARIWDPDTGTCLRTLTGHNGALYSAAWARTPDEQLLLATASLDRTARIWDPDTGTCLRTLTGHNGAVCRAAWARTPDEQLLLATASVDRTVRIWDALAGTCLRTLTGHNGAVNFAAWAEMPSGQLLLATSGEDRIARIWDPDSGAELARLPRTGGLRQSFSWASDYDGSLLLFAADSAVQAGPARVWLVEKAVERVPPPAADLPAARAVLRANSRRLLRLGTGGLWPSLGVLADLVTLTDSASPDLGTLCAPTTLCDPALAALGDDPGIGRLRELARGKPPWRPDARVAFAGLLASALRIPERYAPPAGSDPRNLREALTGAVTARRSGTVPQWRVPIAELRAAGGTITDRTIALLAILGPEACAADPMLPVRLAYLTGVLPALSPRELRLLTGIGAAAANGAVGSGTMTWSPGTAGVARHGALTRLLPTELALPQDLMTIRLAEDQSLYRQHWAPAPPAPEPVTIILDTTPPTYGPAGTMLRLAAHLITTTLWAHGRYPALVTLADPYTASELRVPADLLRIWTASTLHDATATLVTARQTATDTGQPAVFCTHFHTARDHNYRAAPASRLLTTHQPPDAPPPAPTRQWHAHLPPGSGQERLAAAVGPLLLPATNGH